MKLWIIASFYLLFKIGISISESRIFNFEEKSLVAVYGSNVTFICEGSEALLKIGTKSFQADVTQSVAEHTIIASNHYHQANISCTSEGKNETFVDFYVVFLIIEKVLYDVIVGEEQSVIVNYSAYPSILQVMKKESLIRNYYNLPNPQTSVNGTIIIHFVKLTKNDLGLYEINYNSSFPSTNITLNEVSAPLDLRLIFIYASPALSLLVCLIVIIVAVCCVRKKKYSVKEKPIETKSAVKKNAYEKREMMSTSPPEMTFTNDENLSSPHAALKPPSNNALAPPVSQRTTSLEAVSRSENFQQPQRVQQKVHGNFWNRTFEKSRESWNDEEDYVDTCVDIQNTTLRPPGHSNSESHNSKFFAQNFRGQNRHPGYVNQPPQHPTPGVNVSEEQLYEGIS